MDAIKVGLEEIYLGGTSIEKLNIDKSFPWLDKTSQQAIDIERFRWFANGYLAVSPLNSSHIIDVRYSTLPNKVLPLWSIALEKTAQSNEHIKYVTSRSTSSRNYKELLKMIFFKNKTCYNKIMNRDGDGFLINTSDWSEEIMYQMAKDDDFQITMKSEVLL